MPAAQPDAGAVTIEGRGVAALTAALLLARNRIAFDLTGPPPSPGPVLFLHPGTLSLLREVWGIAPADLPALHRVRRRAVKPLPPDEPALIEQPSVVIGSAALLACLEKRLASMLETLPPAAQSVSATPWRLLAAGRTKPPEQANGPRCTMAEVTPSQHWLADRAIFEAVPGGWLFLLPTGADRALLQSQRDAPNDGGDLLQSNLAESQVMPRLIQSVGGEPQTFNAAPHLAQPCAGTNWIAIGDAAMALPPVTGDGVGNGIRTAIWATACLCAVQAGEPAAAVLAFYAWRLRDAFNRMAAHTDTPPVHEPDPDYKPPYRLDGINLIRAG